MAETRTAAIDARGTVSAGGGSVSCLRRVLGPPLIARVVRMAARAGFGGAAIAADAADREAIERALARHGPPPDFALSFTSDADPAGDVALDPRGVYARDALAAAARDGDDPEPAVLVRTRDDVRAAERFLLKSVEKSVQSDGVISFYVIRPLVLPLTRALLPTPVTPNMVTIAAMILGVAAAVLCVAGDAQSYLVAAALFWVGLVIDHVDGQMARLRVKGSRLGEWLDTVTDDVTTFGLMAGVGIGMERTGYDPMWAYVAVTGAILGTIAHATMYYDLARLGRAIDTADYPWFFGTPSEAGATRRGPAGTLARITGAAGYLFRRDAFVTAICVLLVLDLPRALAVVLCVRGLAVVPLLLVHKLLTLARRGDRPSTSRS